MRHAPRQDPGRHRALRLHLRRRRRDHHGRRPRLRRAPRPTWASSRWASASCPRVAATSSCSSACSENVDDARPVQPALHPEGLRDHRHGQGLHLRRGGARAQVPAPLRLRRDPARTGSSTPPSAWPSAIAEQRLRARRCPQDLRPARARTASPRSRCSCTTWSSRTGSRSTTPRSRPTSPRSSAAATRPSTTRCPSRPILDLEREAFLSLCGEAEDAGPDPAHAREGQAAEELERERAGELRELEKDRGKQVAAPAKR